MFTGIVWTYDSKLIQELNLTASLVITLFMFVLQAVERLNIKPGHWKDLVTDEPFVRKDIITIQDPSNLDKFNMANFYHLRQNLKLVDEGQELSYLILLHPCLWIYLFIMQLLGTTI